MSEPHVPDYNAIAELPDELRFYAGIGAAVSRSAALELVYFDLFLAAKGTAADAEAKDFYTSANKRGEVRRKTAAERRRAMEGAVEARLSLKGREVWEPLAARVLEATNADCVRHFLAHTAVSKVDGPFDAQFFDSTFFQTEEYVLVQDDLQALASGAEPRSQDLDMIIAYCLDIDELILDLNGIIIGIGSGELID